MLQLCPTEVQETLVPHVNTLSSTQLLQVLEGFKRHGVTNESPFFLISSIIVIIEYQNPTLKIFQLLLIKQMCQYFLLNGAVGMAESALYFSKSISFLRKGLLQDLFQMFRRGMAVNIKICELVKFP